MPTLDDACSEAFEWGGDRIAVRDARSADEREAAFVCVTR
jgi:hypothetical protein